MTELAPQISEPLLLDVQAVARLVGLSRASVLRMAASGKMPLPLHLGRSRRWRAEELRDWTRAGCPPRSRWEWTANAQQGGRAGER